LQSENWDKLPKVGITWQLSNMSGWGVYGMYLARRMLEREIAVPASLSIKPPHFRLPADELKIFDPMFALSTQLRPFLPTSRDIWVTAPFLVLHSAGNSPARESAGGIVAPKDEDVKIIFFEDGRFTTEDIDHLKRFRCVVCCSRWNLDVLTGLGLKNLLYLPVGVDTDLFKPGPRVERFGKDRFVIFSGGKAEFRKGQDIVLAAFKRFRERHADAILVTAWANLWPESAKTLAKSPHGTGAPPIGPNGQLLIRKWAVDYGIPEDSFMTIGIRSNRVMPDLLQGVDVALFPNRVEGGTNQVAMECMAAGVPTILSANSGHLDLISDVPCIALGAQQHCFGSDFPHEYWESDIDEIIGALEDAYEYWSSRSDREQPSQLAPGILKAHWTWARRHDDLLDAIL
jgi:glycosyltransferase involved in cell wall biosynthesis